jgi:hypothetical protein
MLRKVVLNNQQNSREFSLYDSFQPFFLADHVWPVAWSQPTQLKLKRDCATKEQCADVIHPLRSYNVLAVAQHAGYLAESFLMFATYKGHLRTMKVPSLLLQRWHACVDVILIM